MIQGFGERDTEAFWNEGKCPAKWRAIEGQARRTLERLNVASSPQSLANRKGNGFRKICVKGEWTYEIRINGKWRIFFTWDLGPANVTISDHSQS